MKTITSTEKLVFLNHLLPAYLDRLENDSALIGILGVFQVQCAGNYSTNLILMENVKAQTLPSNIFDLKGSMYKRKADCSSEVKKDVDLLERTEKVSLEPYDKEKLMTRLRKDVHMLAKLNIMDYSLLVCECSGQPPLSSRYAYRSLTEGQFYMIAIIDIFQLFDLQKKIERCWKTLVLRVPPSELSSAQPREYSERFLRYINNST